jgi:hypothetical protein
LRKARTSFARDLPGLSVCSGRNRRISFRQVEWMLPSSRSTTTARRCGTLRTPGRSERGHPCGGSFYNDHDGRNRYIVVKRRESTPASRGVYGVLTRLLADLDSLEHALPPELPYQLHAPKGVITDENDETGILEFTKKFDPARVVLNALVPFLVASIEHFFRESFEIILRYDPAACRKLEGLNRKASFAEVVSVSRGELAIEEIASGWYSFQNIDGIRKAFDEVLGIDISRVLRQRKKVRGRIPCCTGFSLDSSKGDTA